MTKHSGNGTPERVSTLPSLMAHPPTTVAPEPPSFESLLLSAVQSGATVDQLERLLDLRRQLKAEADQQAFDQAMARFQSECPPIRKDKEVFVRNQLRYRYAPLESIVAQVKILLRDNELSYSMDAEVKGSSVLAICTVKHSQGHRQSSKFEVPIQTDAFMSEPQKFASALTFAKRYAFINALGLMTAEDDTDNAEQRSDGATAGGTATLTPVKQGYNVSIHGEPRPRDPLAIQPRFLNKQKDQGKQAAEANARRVEVDPNFNAPEGKFVTLLVRWVRRRTTTSGKNYLAMKVTVEETSSTGYISSWDPEAAMIAMGTTSPEQFRGMVRAKLRQGKGGFWAIEEFDIVRGA